MDQNNDNKKFKPQPKPFKQTKISSIYRVTDQNDKQYYAKFFYQKKLVDYNIFQATEYNQTVLSELSDQIFSEHFLEIKYTYSIPEGFIFITQPYQTTLYSFLKNKVIQEKQAMKIFQQIIKAVYSLYAAGFWHRNIRPQHFVKVGDTWKLESLVFNQQYRDSEGLQSQYLWNPAYQPPQAYDKQVFSDEQLDQMVVWNLGSLLVDILLSHHKLKDKTILDKFKHQPFSFKAIGVKKQFSKQVTTLLGQMLNYNRQERMTVAEMFSNETISKQLARMKKESFVPKMKIYISGKSSLSKCQPMSSDKAQRILGVKQFKQQKQKMEQEISVHIKKKDQSKLESSNEILKTIKKLTERDMQRSIKSIPQQKRQQSQIALSNKKFEKIMQNPYLIQALQPYKCYYDKCEMLIIASSQLDRIDNILTPEILLLNKYAITFVAVLLLHQLAQSMNRNLNFLNLESNLWSEFQSSNEFKGFKQIVNFRRQQRRTLLIPLKQSLNKLRDLERNLLRSQEIEDFIHCNFKLTDFEHVKIPYRKILKCTYDTITNSYNQQKTSQLARIGMYLTYCMTIDKLYIEEDMKDNFEKYFKYMRLPSTNYVPLDQFQQYLDTADKKSLVSHSTYILKKYFFKSSKN